MPKYADAREYTGEWQNNKKQAQMLTKISMRRRRGKKLKHYIGRIWMWPASNNRASKNQYEMTKREETEALLAGYGCGPHATIELAVMSRMVEFTAIIVIR